jgi:hypothetical protein
VPKAATIEFNFNQCFLSAHFGERANNGAKETRVFPKTVANGKLNCKGISNLAPSFIPSCAANVPTPMYEFERIAGGIS